MRGDREEAETRREAPAATSPSARARPPRRGRTSRGGRLARGDALSAPATSARPASAARVPAGLAQGLPAAKRLMPGRERFAGHCVRALLPGEEREERLAVHEQHAVANARPAPASARRAVVNESSVRAVSGRPTWRRARRGTPSRRRGRARLDDVPRRPARRRSPRAPARLPPGPQLQLGPSTARTSSRRSTTRTTTRRRRLRWRARTDGAGARRRLSSRVVVDGGRTASPPRYPSRYATPATASSATPSTHQQPRTREPANPVTLAGDAH